MEERAQDKPKKPLWIFYAGQLLGVVALFMCGAMQLPIELAIVLFVLCSAAGYAIYCIRVRMKNQD